VKSPTSKEKSCPRTPGGEEGLPGESVRKGNTEKKKEDRSSSSEKGWKSPPLAGGYGKKDETLAPEKIYHRGKEKTLAIV